MEVVLCAGGKCEWYSSVLSCCVLGVIIWPEQSWPSSSGKLCSSVLPCSVFGVCSRALPLCPSSTATSSSLGFRVLCSVYVSSPYRCVRARQQSRVHLCFRVLCSVYVAGPYRCVRARQQSRVHLSFCVLCLVYVAGPYPCVRV